MRRKERFVENDILSEITTHADDAKAVKLGLEQFHRLDLVIRGMIVRLDPRQCALQDVGPGCLKIFSKYILINNRDWHD